MNIIEGKLPIHIIISYLPTLKQKAEVVFISLWYFTGFYVMQRKHFTSGRMSFSNNILIGKQPAYKQEKTVVA